MADMTREEAIKLLKDTIERLSALNGYLWPDERKRLLDAFTALRGWVKTADRLPTEPDDYPFIVYMEGWFENPYDAVRVWTAGEIRYIPEEVIAYMPLLPLPKLEVEE